MDNAPCSPVTVELFYYTFWITISYFKCQLFADESGWLGPIWSSVCCCRGDVTGPMPSSDGGPFWNLYDQHLHIFATVHSPTQI